MYILQPHAFLQYLLLFFLSYTLQRNGLSFYIFCTPCFHACWGLLPHLLHISFLWAVFLFCTCVAILGFHGFLEAIASTLPSLISVFFSVFSLLHFVWLVLLSCLVCSVSVNFASLNSTTNRSLIISSSVQVYEHQWWSFSLFLQAVGICY